MKQEMGLERVETNRRTPLVHVLNSRLVLVANRSGFIIYEYDYSKRKGVGQKKQSRFASMKMDEKILDNPNLQFKEVLNSADEDFSEVL
jgi:hypothetical protein